MFDRDMRSMGMVRMEAWPTCTSLGSMKQGRLAIYVHPAVGLGASGCAAGMPNLRTRGQARRGCAIMIPDHSGIEEERAAGGPGPELPNLSGRAALTLCMAPILGGALIGLRR
jgi:hypothetical protein